MLLSEGVRVVQLISARAYPGFYSIKRLGKLRPLDDHDDHGHSNECQRLKNAYVCINHNFKMYQNLNIINLKQRNS